MRFYSEVGHGDSEVNSVDDALKSEHDYANSTLDAKRMHNTLIDLLTRKPTAIPKRLLDVGCGYGFFSREALSRGFEVCALELATNERAIAERLTGLKPIPMSFEDFADPEGSFSAILMSQVLEHAFNPNLWVQKACRLLDHNGILAIALPNFGSVFRLVLQEKDPYICPPAHLNFFSPKSLSRLLINHGFTVEEIQWVSRIDPNVLFRRIPLTRLLGSAIRFPLMAILTVFDASHLGMMINIYARKC